MLSAAATFCCCSPCPLTLRGGPLLFMNLNCLLTGHCPLSFLGRADDTSSRNLFGRFVKWCPSRLDHFVSVWGAKRRSVLSLFERNESLEWRFEGLVHSWRMDEDPLSLSLPSEVAFLSAGRWWCSYLINWMMLFEIGFRPERLPAGWFAALGFLSFYFSALERQEVRGRQLVALWRWLCELLKRSLQEQILNHVPRSSRGRDSRRSVEN